MNDISNNNQLKRLSYVLWLIPLTMAIDLINPVVNSGESFFYFILHRVYNFSYFQRELVDNIVLIIYSTLALVAIISVYRFGKLKKKRVTFLLILLFILCLSIVILTLNGKGWWKSPYEIIILIFRLVVFVTLIINIGKIKSNNISIN